MVMKNRLNDQCITYSQMNMIFNARIFWRRLVAWTRAYIISRYSGIGSSDETFGRLYLESSDFGDILQIIFGREITEKFAGYINRRTTLIRELINAQQAGNVDAVNENVRLLYENASERAAFMASFNPYWNEAELKGYMEKYIQFTIEQINAFMSGNYHEDIAAYERLVDLTTKMGDSFAQGLYQYITMAPLSGGNFGSQEFQRNSEQVKQFIGECFTLEQVNSIYAIFMFWFELATWTRAYIRSSFIGAGNTAEIYERLRQVPKDYGNNMRKIFGEKITEDYIQMVDTHIILIDSLIKAQKDKNIDEINRVIQQLYQNADQRAAFLASINPYWDEKEWRTRMYNYNRSTIEEMTAFLSGDTAMVNDIFGRLLDLSEIGGRYFLQGTLNYLNISR